MMIIAYFVGFYSLAFDLILDMHFQLCYPRVNYCGSEVIKQFRPTLQARSQITNLNQEKRWKIGPKCFFDPYYFVLVSKPKKKQTNKQNKQMSSSGGGSGGGGGEGGGGGGSVGRKESLLVGCVGKPSAGKSSFLNAATDANAKVGA
jgi:uncharacterized membrane protein YgcG